MSSTPRARRPGTRTAAGIAIAATMLTTAGAAAQSPSSTPPPDTASAPTQTTGRPGWGDHAGPGRGDRGAWDEGRGFAGRGMPDLRQGGGISVTSSDGTSLVLTTADGWTRTIDTTGVALTRDGVAIAIGDIQVGEPVRVVQTRNADGTYTVTGIEVQPARATGTIGSVSADGFTVVGGNGSTTTVSVTPETTWSARGSTSTSITDATAGRAVAVEGTLQTDGSIIATRVRLG